MITFRRCVDIIMQLAVYLSPNAYARAGRRPPVGVSVNDEVAELLMRYFIQRRDVKAYQCMEEHVLDHTRDLKYQTKPHAPGGYHPIRTAFTVQDVRNHLDGKITHGHYLMDSANMCRVFAFDIDLNKEGFWPPKPHVEGNHEGIAFNPMKHWMSRKPDFARMWIKRQFRMISETLAGAITKELGLPALISYSGSKGMHVYALAGPITGEQARAGIDIVLDSLECFVPVRGRNFFKHVNEDPVLGYPNFTIEVFPKQERVDNKHKGLGNLMRLPLGRNLKTTDPTFFVDCRYPMTELKPLDPAVALKTLSRWGGDKFVGG